MAESGTIYSNYAGLTGYAEYRIQYDWELLSKSSSGWKIRITATFQGKGSDSEMSLWGHRCYITIGGTSVEIYKQVTISEGGSQTMGSQEVTIPISTGSPISFSATCKVAVSWASGTMTASGSLSVPYPYTSCSAPTTVSLSKTLAKTNENVTLSWSGATAGTSNSIKSYGVYRATSSSGTYSLYKTVTSTATSGSVSVVTGSSYGSTYYFKIITNGTQSGYSSGYSKVSSALLANTPPSAPTYKYTNSKNTGTVIPASGATITVTATAGASNNSGQSSSVQYSTNNSTWYSYSSSLSTTAAKTWYFRTTDGIDVSSSVSFSVTKNATPTVACVATATDSPTTSSTMSKTCKLVFSSLSSGDTIRIYLKRGTSTSSLGGYEFLSSFTASGSTQTISSYDIISKLSGSLFGQVYKLYVTATDKYDTSSYITATLKNKNGTTTLGNFSFGSLPTFSSIARSGSGTNGYFHDSLAVSYTGNVFSSLELRYTTGTSGSSSSVLGSLSNSGTSATFTGKASLFTPGTKYNFYIKATLGSQTVYLGPKSLTKASYFSFSNLTKSGGDCYVLEDESSKNLDYQTIAFASTVRPSDCISAFSSSNDNDINVYLDYGSQSQSSPFTYSLSGSTAYLKCQNKSVYGFTLSSTSNFFNFSIHGRYTVNVRIKVTNSFGMISTGTTTMVIDLTYKPKLVSSSAISLNVVRKSNDSSTTYSTANQTLNEGNKIKVQFYPVKAYAGETITARTYLGEYASIGGTVTYSASPFSTHTFSGYSGTGTATLQKPTAIFTVPKITSPKRYKFKTIYTNTKNQSVTEYSDMVLNVDQYTTIIGGITSVVPTYSNNVLSTVSVKFKFSELGGKGYSSYTSNTISTTIGLETVKVSAKSPSGATKTTEFSTSGATGYKLTDLIGTEKTIVITPTTTEKNSDGFLISLYAYSYINDTQEADSSNSTYTYYTPVQKTTFTGFNFYLSAGASFSIRKSGVSVNSVLEDNEAFSVGPGTAGKTTTNFHGLNLINVIIDCGTW